MELYGENAPTLVLENAAVVKSKLGKFYAADNLYTKALKLYGENAPTLVLKNAAAVKFKLGKFPGSK